jgi:hypothetical protein
MIINDICTECMIEAVECGAPHNWEVSEVAEIPNCDYCTLDRAAEYDAKSKFGNWGFMCQHHFEIHEATLGLGKGQKLVKVGA